MVQGLEKHILDSMLQKLGQTFYSETKRNPNLKKESSYI